MTTSQAYWIYWGACFATVVTWVFAVAAAADDAWLSYNEASGLELGEDCIFEDDIFENDICELYEAATAFQFMATVIVSIVLVLVVVAACTSPPTTGLLGLVLGIMLAVFSVFQMIAFALMASMVDKLNDSLSRYALDDYEAGPTVGVAITSWLLGLVGTIIILALRSSATNNDEGPFRKCMSGGGGMAGGAKAGQNVGTV